MTVSRRALPAWRHAAMPDRCREESTGVNMRHAASVPAAESVDVRDCNIAFRALGELEDAHLSGHLVKRCEWSWEAVLLVREPKKLGCGGKIFLERRPAAGERCGLGRAQMRWSRSRQRRCVSNLPVLGAGRRRSARGVKLAGGARAMDGPCLRKSACAGVR